MADDPDGIQRDIVERFFAASERGDAATVAVLMTDDMVMTWPQSGERFRGREAVLAAMGSLRTRPTFAAAPRLVGAGDVWTLMVPLRYGEDTLHYVAVVELVDGRIARGTGYWAAPFPAQPERAAYLDASSG